MNSCEGRGRLHSLIGNILSCLVTFLFDVVRPCLNNEKFEINISLIHKEEKSNLILAVRILSFRVGARYVKRITVFPEKGMISNGPDSHYLVRSHCESGVLLDRRKVVSLGEDID